MMQAALETSIGNKRRKARKAKTNSNKRDRQFLQKDLKEQIMELC